MFCAFQIIQLFSVVFYVVRAVLKFDFRLVIKKNLSNSDQKKEDRAVIQTNVFDRIFKFLPTVVANVKGLYPRCAGQLHSL